MDRKNIDWSVYLVTDRAAIGDRSIVDVVRAAISGGVTAVQLRDKEMPVREMITLANALLEVTRPAGVPLIVNDRIDVALATGADGLHVGQSDLPGDIARRLLGPDLLLGISATTVEEARLAEQHGADYLGVGDVFGTPSKPDAGVPIGLQGLAEITRIASIPVVAIGGITLENAARTIEAGASGVAVISAILRTPDPAVAAENLLKAVRNRTHNFER